jgi:redox-sensitive bicupin YhaK (pirin superfamily)
LQHQDSTGRNEIIRENDVQIMSAGAGIAHSEMNANKDKEVKFLQIWVFPKERNIAPRYEQKSFDPAKRINQLLTVVAPDEAQAVWINQDAWFSLGNFDAGFTTQYQSKKSGNGFYVFVLEGQVDINGVSLNKRDGLGITETDQLHITAGTNSQILLMDIPMQF